MNIRGTTRLYFGTLRHLKPIQIYARAWFHLARPSPDRRPAPPPRVAGGKWVTPAARRPSQFGPYLFRFLNRDGDLDEDGWDDPAADKLWRYHLHYFDDLNAAGARERIEWHRTLIARWITENEPGAGTGWEPYPSSLRIVNWIKWSLSGNPSSEQFLDSLAVQARWLSQRIEYHLLGNHLLANAKALVFAGLFFDGPEAATWLDKGCSILARQISEQVLPDGDHFELSPMYHALALEDVLDLLNAACTYPNCLRAGGLDLANVLSGQVGSMRNWLAAMCHPDHEISFFNDAAFGIAPTPTELEAYAARLGLASMQNEFPAIKLLEDSGYIRLQAGPAVALLDVARIGPDYLPGHAHADTLSFELSLAGQRLLVNSGTSTYAKGPQRLRERGTAAHNTVMVAGENSSEVWSGFRVARRAYPFGLEQGSMEGALLAACAHDGYRSLRGHPIHRRTWRLDFDELRVTDTITGGAHPAEARFHFHPDATVELDCLGGGGVARTSGFAPVRLRVKGGAARLENSQWYPEFGAALPCRCLAITFQDAKCDISFRWGPARPQAQ